MRMITLRILLVLLATPATADPEPMVLWYDEPAKAWTDALAVAPYDPSRPDALKALPEVRKLDKHMSLKFK